MSYFSSVTSRDSLRSRKMNNAETTNGCIENVESPEEAEEIMPVVSPSVWELLASWGTYYLHIPSAVKIGYYFFTLVALSMIKETVEVPHVETITGKYSFFNRIFVKKGWAFTVSTLILHQLTSITLLIEWKARLKQFVVRAITTTFFFYIWCVVIFNEIEKYTESCTYKNIKINLPKKECNRQEGHVYTALDISGHIYLLTFCVLVMMEESKEILYFLCLGGYLRGVSINTPEKIIWPKRGGKLSKSLRTRFTIVAPLVIFSFLCIFLLSLLWDAMLLVTMIYYHTILEKTLGSFLAVSMWCLLYKYLFPTIFGHRFFHS
ncbi:acyl-coenzyme A diphosphatase FITM2-like [Homarus americanus]|uniref:acyl-coenzyme A diphosphatase FITM2-like n=1 Tax=Homarus americanus TaxID=6706 RepID=UPI001C496BC3|nr:acyl-coenzyme A diphosphatase FITM2-like [Homarus americanus]